MCRSLRKHNGQSISNMHTKRIAVIEFIKYKLCKTVSYFLEEAKFNTILNSENSLRDGKTIAWLLYPALLDPDAAAGITRACFPQSTPPPHRIVLSSLLLEKILSSSPPYVHCCIAALATTAVTNDAYVYIRAGALALPLSHLYPTSSGFSRTERARAIE